MFRASPRTDSPLHRSDIFHTILCRTAACALACVFSLPLLLLALSPSPAKAADHSPVWKAGKLQVFAIQDRPGGMSIDIFSGPASPEERQQYFTDGKAPASINVFLLRIDGKNILVDTGFGTVAPGKSALIPALNELGLAPESINVVVLTHMHMDHVGGLLQHKERAFPKAHVMVAKAELDYWLDLAEKSPDNANAVLVKTVTEVYGKDILPPFSFDKEILPGVTALEATGHTPGHTVLRLDAEGKSLLIIGDLLHAAALQFALPEECASYDIDPKAAVASRIRILDLAAQNSIPIAGMHIPFPGHGNVTKADKGFSFSPSE